MCRQAVTILFPVFTADELGAANDHQNEEQFGQVIDRVNRFNRYNSGRGVPLSDLLRDFPTVLRHFLADLFSPDGFSFVYMARISVVMVMCLAYLISPLDILPEAVFGLLGILDDLRAVMRKRHFASPAEGPPSRLAKRGSESGSRQQQPEDVPDIPGAAPEERLIYQQMVDSFSVDHRPGGGRSSGGGGAAAGRMWIKA
uniref:RING-type E3 ubiquitin transferase n=1 Tax=Macrostomum lignano TaxID=282301 RepID=A0A1I8FRU2_9PLAT